MSLLIAPTSSTVKVQLNIPNFCFEEENLLEIALNSRREKESVSDMRMSLIELPNTSGWTCPKTQVPKQKDVLPQIGFQPESTDYTYAKKSRVLKNRKVEVRDRAQYFEDVVF